MRRRKHGILKSAGRAEDQQRILGREWAVLITLGAVFLALIISVYVDYLA